MQDFLLFRRMLTPWLLQVLFWGLTLVCLFVGSSDFFHGNWKEGLQIFFFGPIALRILTELIILFFRMNETLTDVRNILEKDKE